MTQVSVKPRLPIVPLSDSHQMVCITQVELRKNGGSNVELSNASGYLFLMVMALSWRKSMHGRRLPSFLATKKKPAATGEEDGPNDA